MQFNCQQTPRRACNDNNNNNNNNNNDNNNNNYNNNNNKNNSDNDNNLDEEKNGYVARDQLINIGAIVKGWTCQVSDLTLA